MTGGSSSHAAAPQAPSCVNLDDNMDDAVQFGLFNLLLHILCHSCAKLNLGVADVYACSYVTLSEILHAPIHDELNNSHKREGTTTTHNHIETLCMVCGLNTIPHSVGIIKE